MNDRQALGQARKRWGKTAAVKHEPGRADRHPYFQGDFLVGRIVFGFFFEVEGEGTSWTAAFRDADAKEHRAELSLRMLYEGYRWGRPGPEAEAIDREAAESRACPECGSNGREYQPYKRENGNANGGYRAFALCLSCGHAEEF